MKKWILCAAAVVTLISSQAQTDPSFRTALGYTHDYPGLNGYTLAGEYRLPVAGQWEAGAGMKYADMNGHPRTPSTAEFTRAVSLDLNLYWVPLRSDEQVFRIGLGYSFSFYSIQRAYPVSTQTDGKTVVSWPIDREKGRTTGINLILEYEHSIAGSPFSIGLRGACYKAYDRTWFIGPVLGYRW